ncbi:MAG: hypothetical protein FH761_17735 [Firmicutes bacterium]|nr:hypothetical protein [Bacillota bacterium]
MIQNYLISNCLLIIEDLNQKFDRHDSEEIQRFAVSDFDESDLVFLIAYPFRNLMKVSMQGKNEDIKVRNLDFTIEVKYLYATKSSAGNYSNKRKFHESFIKDFNWLIKEIKEGNKGKTAFVIGWFNTYGSFSNIMQLGKNRGKNPQVNIDKIKYFPFLYTPSTECHVNEITYRYSQNDSVYTSESYSPDTISIPDLKEGKVNCIFLGKESDKFHFAIYY